MANPHAPSAHGEENPEVRHETSDANVRAIFAFGAALIVVGVAIHLLVWLLFAYFSAREGIQPPAEYPLAIQQQDRQPPEPRLQTNPKQDLIDLRAREDRALGSYGWIDQNAGVVRIPIDQAMKLTVQRGLPARTGPK